MADVLKAEGMVLAATNTGGQVYPFACAKDATLSISRDFLELAPKTNSYTREYLLNRSAFTVTGTGLIKLDQAYMQDFDFFDPFITATDDKFMCYLDMIDAQNNYKVYKFECYFQELTLNSSYDSTPNYSFTLQGTGAITNINIVDTRTVASGKITGLDTADYKLVALGYGGKWYFNYTVTEPSTGVFEIDMTGVANGTVVKAAYLAI